MYSIRVNERAENERRERERVAERKKPNNVHDRVPGAGKEDDALALKVTDLP